jgi:hypothetical protein
MTFRDPSLNLTIPENKVKAAYCWFVVSRYRRFQFVMIISSLQGETLSGSGAASDSMPGQIGFLPQICCCLKTCL